MSRTLRYCPTCFNPLKAVEVRMIDVSLATKSVSGVDGSDHEGELVGGRLQIQRVCEGGDVGDHECADLGGRSN